MAVKDYKTNPDENTTISGINIAEGCPPSGINNAIRQVMADVKNEYDEQEGKNTEFSKGMSGATDTDDGTSGNVPAPRAGDQNKPLRGDGTWGDYIDCETSRLSGVLLDAVMDIPEWWVAKGNAIFALKDVLVNNQPSQYGTIINTVISSELQQIFIMQPDGEVYKRGANSSGWNGHADDNGTWRRISNTMPVGSVYVQFSGQSAPADLFGGTWSNVSYSYAGLFFRAEGGSAAVFGSTQSDGSPEIYGRTTGFDYQGTGETSWNYGAFRTDTRFVGSSYGKDQAVAGVSFSASRSSNKYGASSEVRPINSTIRIWKRTA